MKPERVFVFMCLLSTICVVLAANNAVVSMERKEEPKLEELLEVDFLFPASTNTTFRSRKALQRYLEREVITMAPPIIQTPHPHREETKLLIEEEDFLPTEIFLGEPLSRDKRATLGSGDEDTTAFADVTLQESFAAAVADEDARRTSVQTGLTQGLTANGVGVNTVTVNNIINDNGNARYNFSVTFTGATDRESLAFALERLWRDETEIGGFTISTSPRICNAAGVNVNVICLLCPADRPCTDAGVCAEFSTAASRNTFESGPGVADRELPSNVDAMATLTVLGDGFPVGISYEKEIYIGDNGIVCFGAPFNPYDLRSINDVGVRKCVIIFGADFDNRYTNGHIYYQGYPAGHSWANLMLDRSNSEIRARTIYRNFRASWVGVITWRNVPEFTRFSQISSQVNTFQLVLVTDGILGFAIFNYISITASDVFRGQAVHGYRTGMAYNYELLYSRRGGPVRPNPPFLNAVRGSTGAPGLWIFKIGEIFIPNFRAMCLSWFESNRRDASYFQSRARVLGNNMCPCRRRVLFLIAIFLPTPPLTSAAIYCGERKTVSSVDSYECCYDVLGRFIRRYPDGGGYNRYSRRFHPLRHRIHDSDPKNWCCRQSNLCAFYQFVRPISTCRVRRRSRFRFNFGEPHITTLDGKTYTFNGIGEYRVLEIGSTFKLQGRTSQAVSNNGQNVQASVFSAFAAEVTVNSLVIGRVHVGLNPNKTGMEIYLDNIDVTSAFYTEASFERFLPFVNAFKEDDTTVGFAFTELNIVLGVRIVSGTLSQSVIVPDNFMTQTIGLMGNFNDDDADDFRLPDGTVLPANSTDRELFPFGIAWAVPNQASSVFHYAPTETRAAFIDNSFTPFFSDQITPQQRNTALGFCTGQTGVEQCIFDFVVTGNADLARAAITEQQEAADATAQLENRAPTLDGTTKVDVEVGQTANLFYNASDADGNPITYVIVDGPSSFSLGPTTGIGTFSPPTTDPVSIRVASRDSNNVESPVLDVTVRICPGCGNNGRCDYSTPRTPITSEADSLFQIASCICNVGYTGTLCNEDRNGCSDDPCGLRATCTDLSPAVEVASGVAYQCSNCPDGYTIINNKCENIDECAINGSCPDNSQCTDTLGSFMCTCNVGYRRNSASECVDIDECFEQLHNCAQTCNNTIGNFTCGCFEFYTLNGDGITCSEGTLPDTCTALGCGSNAFCVDSGAACECAPGYELNADNRTCSDVIECSLRLCAQSCVDTAGSFSCSCNPGYQLAQDNLDCGRCEFPNWGPSCQFECECQGRASRCDPVHGCVCNEGWTGVNCLTNVNECLANPAICGDSQRCVDTEGSFTCVCENGYTRNETTCIDVNECETDTSNTTVCPDNSVCQNLIGSFACNCNPGYRKEGGNCVDIDECINGQATCEHMCMNMAGSYNCYCSEGFILNNDRKTCSRDLVAGSPCDGLTNLQCSHYCLLENNLPKCQCMLGYFLAADQVTCLDVNECADDTLNRCTLSTSCVNTQGSYTCSCPVGQKIQNDGRSCAVCDDNHWGEGCANVCGCAPLGTDTCDRIMGCVCKSGWTGVTCSEDKDECGTSVCQANSDCVNLPGSFTCKCRTGYAASAGGSVCNEINECSSSDTNVCDQDCQDTIGSYYCSCRTGFILQGQGTCLDIDECTLGIHDCQQVCRNTAGKFTCECYEGYQLDPVGRRNCIPITGATTCSRTDCDSTNGGCRVNAGNDTCFCNKGYNLNANGFTCNDIDECSQNICTGSCVNQPAGSYTCSCDPGFQLGNDQATCEACPLGTWGNNCGDNCTCSDTNTLSCNATDGSCTCRPGWTGTTCETDIAECTLTPNICGNNGLCNERDGSFGCSCVAGYLRTNGVCNPCSSTTWGVNCNQNCTCNFANAASCDAVTGQCRCRSGWTGATCNTNVNECSNTTSPVCTGPNELCRDTQGSFVCDCASGYQKSTDNTNCVDTNECLSTTANNCTFQCTNTDGSFVCTCPPGYIGDGNNCTVNFGSYFVTIFLNLNQDAVIAMPNSAAFQKLREDIGSAVDEILAQIPGNLFLNANVTELSTGSFVTEIRVDMSETDNLDGALAVALERIAEDRSLNVNGSPTPLTNVTYRGIPILREHTVCDVLRIIRTFGTNEYCEVEANGLPVVRTLEPTGPNTQLIIGLSVPLLIILLILIIAIIYLCCCRKRTRSGSSDERDNQAFRSAFVGNLPTKSNFGASRYMLYSPHTLSEAGSQASGSSGRQPRRGRKTGSHDFADMPHWSFDSSPGFDRNGRGTDPRTDGNGLASNFSWEHLFDRLEPLRNGQFEVPRPAVRSSPNKTFRDSLA